MMWLKTTKGMTEAVLRATTPHPGLLESLKAT